MKRSYMIKLVEQIITDIQEGHADQAAGVARSLRIYLTKPEIVYKLSLVTIKGDQFINTIKGVRAITGRGLREAKEFVELVRDSGQPQVVTTGDAKQMGFANRLLSACGAQTTIEEVKNAG